MDYYVFDSRKDKDRNPWMVKAGTLPYMILEVQDEKRFRNTQFLLDLFAAFHAPLIVLCMDMPDKKRIEEVEECLSIHSEVSTGFLTLMEYSEANAKLLLNTSEQFGKWEEWGIGFLESPAASEVLEKCKRDDYPLGPLVKEGLLSYLTIRDFDCERMSLFAFREERFDEFQSLVVQHLALSQGLRFRKPSD